MKAAEASAAEVEDPEKSAADREAPRELRVAEPPGRCARRARVAAEDARATADATAGATADARERPGLAASHVHKIQI